MLHYIFFPSRPFSRGLSRLSLSPSPGLVALSGSLSRSLPASGINNPMLVKKLGKRKGGEQAQGPPPGKPPRHAKIPFTEFWAQ